MKLLLSAIMITFMLCGDAFAANYTLTIDGKGYDIDIGKQQVVKLADGRTLLITLNKKAIISFKSDNFSFDHPSIFSPSRTDLSNGIHQTMMASPLGTLVMVQEYTTMDPSGLVDMMLNELTKEEAQYGYKITKRLAAKTLTDGTKLAGKMAISAYKGTEYIRQVLCYQARDAGLLIVTQFEKANSLEERQIIDVFWSTLKVSLR